MAYSYTQISTYLACPRRYQIHYRLGWRERKPTASLAFGRVFERAVQDAFAGGDAIASFETGWAAMRTADLTYGRSTSWAGLAEDGKRLLQMFAAEQRIRVQSPERELGREFWRTFAGGRRFFGVLDAVAELDGVHTVIDFKTASARYRDDLGNLFRLDPQLVCYSWLTGIENVAFVVFVRKRCPEIQYLKATVSAQQRRDWEALVGDVVERIEAARFPQIGGVRFPADRCSNCPFLGHCLGNPQLLHARSTRRQESEFDWLHELAA